MTDIDLASGRGAQRRRVLLIAYHFPPIRGSSGVQRTLRFAQHLGKFGWDPVVLTISPEAYPDSGPSAGNEIPPGVEVHRAFGLDAARQLRVGRWYPGFLAVPDRWRTWAYWAIPKAINIVRERKIEVVWSTFPVATAHRIGMRVAERTGLPWVAEFRDPMWQGAYPPDPKVNKAFKSLEAQIVERAAALVMTTPGAIDQYSHRFAGRVDKKLQLIENGFDEEVFARAEAELKRPPANRSNGPLVVLHSGVIYPSERDPTALFDALCLLKSEGLISREKCIVRFRACSHEAHYWPMLKARSIDDIVELAPPTDYLSALGEMLKADALLLMQAKSCNSQIPAKLYEYMRARRPIWALTDREGDTARTLRSVGVDTVASLDDKEQIKESFLDLLEQLALSKPTELPRGLVGTYSREAQTHKMALLLDSLVSSPAVTPPVGVAAQ